MEMESILRQVIYMLGLEGEKSDLYPEKKKAKWVWLTGLFQNLNIYPRYM